MFGECHLFRCQKSFSSPNLKKKFNLILHSIKLTLVCILFDLELDNKFINLYKYVLVVYGNKL